MLTVRAWRKARDMSVNAMSEALGVHPHTYNSWEKNPRKISIEYAYKIANVLNIKVSDIDFLCSDAPQKCGE